MQDLLSFLSSEKQFRLTEESELIKNDYVNHRLIKAVNEIHFPDHPYISVDLDVKAIVRMEPRRYCNLLYATIQQTQKVFSDSVKFQAQHNPAFPYKKALSIDLDLSNPSPESLYITNAMESLDYQVLVNRDAGFRIQFALSNVEENDASVVMKAKLSVVIDGRIAASIMIEPTSK